MSDETREIEELDAMELRELFAAISHDHRDFHCIYRALQAHGIDGYTALATRRADRLAIAENN